MIFGVRNLFSKLPEKPHPKDIILTGIPRSGTTLVCKLLCDTPDTIGLNEPMKPEFFTDRQRSIEEVENCFIRFRHSLLKKKTAIARTDQGRITDNAFSKERKKKLRRTKIRFDKELSEDFTLVMKHCAEFSLLFPELTERFTCFAMVRNPLALLGSWNSVSVPVSRGRVAKSKRLLPSFYESIEKRDSLLDKQIHIMKWYFNQYKSMDPSRIIKYEELISSNGKNLEGIVGEATIPSWDLKGRNTSKLYDSEHMKSIYERLANDEEIYNPFYSTEDLQVLLKSYEQ